MNPTDDTIHTDYGSRFDPTLPLKVIAQCVRTDIRQGRFPAGMKVSVRSLKAIRVLRVNIRELPADIQVFSTAYLQAREPTTSKGALYSEDMDKLFRSLERVIAVYNYNQEALADAPHGSHFLGLVGLDPDFEKARYVIEKFSVAKESEWS